MGLEPDAVTGAVDELLAVPSGGDDRAGGSVHRLGRRTRPYRLDRLGLGGLQYAVVREEVVGSVPDRVRAGGVGAVAARDRSADVDHHDVPHLEASVGDLVVRAGPVRSTADDHEVDRGVSCLDDRLGDVLSRPRAQCVRPAAGRAPARGRGRWPGRRARSSTTSAGDLMTRRPLMMSPASRWWTPGMASRSRSTVVAVIELHSATSAAPGSRVATSA